MAAVGGRLDRVMTDCFAELSRRAAKDEIARGAVFVEGRRCRVASREVRAGARLRWFEIGATPTGPGAGSGSDPSSESPSIPVLFEDADLLVLDKPPGVSVNESETAGQPSVVDRHRWVAPHLVHRLDRDTSGVLVLARHAEAARALSSAFAERRTRKVYWALTTGAPRSGLEDAPIGADPRRPRARRVRPDGQAAQTWFETRDAVESLAWVEARPITGRTHQIRIHLAHQRAPVLGDLLYGGVERVRVGDAVVVAPRTALHARVLEIEISGQWRRFESPFPEDLRPLASFDWDAEVSSGGSPA